MKKGFTLIELLVVVLIMGILASVAMPQYFKSVEKSRTAEAISVIRAIDSAQERAYMQKGYYADRLSDLDIGISNLTYFTVTGINIIDGGTRLIRASRLDEAGAGLGKYTISFVLGPEDPGSQRDRIWECSPTSAGCNSFLPK